MELNSEGLRVLLVEDDKTCMLLTETLLKKFKYEVVAHQNPIDALKELREKNGEFDIVLTDIHMPAMNGLDLLDEIKKDFIKLPVVLMSADGEKDVIIDGINRGAALYFMKPLGMRQIKNLWQHTIEVMDTSQVLEGLENALTLEDDDDSTPEGVTNEEEDDSGSSNDEVNLEGKENDDQENRESVDSKEETEEQKDDETASQKKQRMMWTPDLHNKFLDAIESIGEEHVVPKRILEVMNVPGLTRENVASHLQKYRIYVKKLKEEDKNIERSRVRSMAQSALGTPAFASNYPTALPNIQQALSQYSQPSQNPLLRDEYFQGDEVVPPLDQPNSTNFHQPDPSRAAAERETQSLNNAVFEEIQNLTSDMPTMQQIVPQQNDIGSSYDNLSYQLQQLSSINNNNNFDGNSRMINPNPNSSGSLYTGPMPGGELSNIPNMNINYIDRHVSVVAGGVREPQVVSVPHETPIFSSDFTTQNEAYGDGFSNSNQFFELPSFNNVVTQELSSNHSLPPLPESMPPLPSMAPLPPLSPLPPLPEQLEVPTEQNGDGLLDELVRVLALM